MAIQTANARLNVESKAVSRLLFVDNIRVFLTFLVLTHHLMIIYAGSGNWVYMEGREDIVVNSLGGWFCAANQSYFMGLFLLIGAYFIPGSYDRKGGLRFLKDRLIRLGIPLAIYCWVINPVFFWLLQYRDVMPIWRFFPVEYFRGGQILGQGPLWFVETLLIFSLIYVLWRVITSHHKANAAEETEFPRNGTIVICALLIGLGSFLVRLLWHIDAYSFGMLNLQLPFYVPYIVLFILGLIAYRRNWLVKLPDKTGRMWLIIAIVLILCWAPMMFLNGAADSNYAFKGGLNWQSFLYSMWESFLCLSACIGVIYFFRSRLNHQGKLAGFLAPNAYTAYLIHAPIITFLAVAFKSVYLYPLLKWAIVAAIALPLCFGLSSLVRKIPLTDRVL